MILTNENDVKYNILLSQSAMSTVSAITGLIPPRDVASLERDICGAPMVQLGVKYNFKGKEWTCAGPGDYLRHFPPPSWERVVEEADRAGDLDDLDRILGKEVEYFPLIYKIFAAFWLVPLTSVKVVILGQDPYHQRVHLGGPGPEPRAQGVSFSVHKNDSVPSSLSNIYTELTACIHGFSKPDHGDLTEWCRQGVFLLNRCLTVRPDEANSHESLWDGFITKVIRSVCAHNQRCIFMLWGKEAQKMKPIIGDKAVILETSHPSGFSARRGFYGCKHFALANQTLMANGSTAVDWTITPRNGPPKMPTPPPTVPLASSFSFNFDFSARPVIQTQPIPMPAIQPMNVSMPVILGYDRLPITGPVGSQIPYLAPQRVSIQIPSFQPPNIPIPSVQRLNSVTPPLILPIITLSGSVPALPALAPTLMQNNSALTY